MVRKKKVVKAKRSVKITAHKATFFRRVIAYILDLLVIGLIISLPLGFAAAGSIESLEEFDFSPKGFLMSIVLGTLTILYWSVFELKMGQSPGKVIAGIYVMNTKKKKLTFTQTLIRNITKISTLLLILDCLYMFFKRTNQRFTETLAETEVLRK